MPQRAVILGSGPNGLAAGIRLAQAGVKVTVLERLGSVGGACATAEVTLPGFRHDLGASAFPMGVASPFFRGLNLGVPWVWPEAECAHPLDDGSAVMLERSVKNTAAGLDARDRRAYQDAFGWMGEQFLALAEDLLGPVQHVPKHPLLLARFGLGALGSASGYARAKFSGVRARALFAGMAAHSVLPLEQAGSAAVGMVLLAAGHGVGWPVVGGGAGVLTALLASRLRELGGEIVTGCEVTELPDGLVLGDVTPRQMLALDVLQDGQGRLSAGYRRELGRFRYGAGAFKVDYALREAIPWRAKDCLRAATVHVCGTLEEVAASEKAFDSKEPFVLVVQPSLFDPLRAPDGKHTAWAYCHVPLGTGADWLPKIEAQMERFAPGFGECVLARKVWGPAALEAWNSSLVGGDVGAGKMNPGQVLFRPTPALYKAGDGIYFCGASTPPGGGVHGMAGFHAAERVLRDLSGSTFSS